MYNWFNYSRVKKQLEKQLKENAELREENKNLEDILNSIGEDGTIEHNNAIKLRQENAKLRQENAKLNLRITELTKEVLGLTHLKTENIELIEKLKKESQKHTTYPLHWGGYNKNIIDFVESEFSNEDPLEGKQVEFNAEELLSKTTEHANTLKDLPKSFPNEFQETSWEQAAANLALKVVKLERKIEELLAREDKYND